MSGRVCLEVSYCPSMPKFPMQTAIEILQGMDEDPAFLGSDHVVSMLERFGLGHRLDEYPSVWSDGEKHRLGIALCLSMRSNLYVLDEPLTSIDGYSHARIIEEIESVPETSQVFVSAHMAGDFFSLESGWTPIQVGLVNFLNDPVGENRTPDLDEPNKWSDDFLQSKTA